MLGGQPFYLGHLGKTPVYIAPDAVMNLLLVWMWCDKSLAGFVIMLMSLITVILIHESGHALMARISGMQDITIILSFMGGLCSYNGNPGPSVKLPISLAGPVINLLTAGGLWLAFRYVPWLDSLDPLILGYLFLVMVWSLGLGLFNLLPIYPLDGGQATLAVSRMVARNDANARRFTLSLSVAAVPAVLVMMYLFHFTIGAWTLVIFAIALLAAFRDLR